MPPGRVPLPVGGSSISGSKTPVAGGSARKVVSRTKPQWQDWTDAEGMEMREEREREIEREERERRGARRRERERERERDAEEEERYMSEQAGLRASKNIGTFVVGQGWVKDGQGGALSRSADLSQFAKNRPLRGHSKEGGEGGRRGRSALREGGGALNSYSGGGWVGAS
jgi:hypothetical protein